MRTYVGGLAAARQTSDSKESETAASDLPTSTKTAPSEPGSHTRLFSQSHPTHARKVLRSEDTTTTEARLAVAGARAWRRIPRDRKEQAPRLPIPSASAAPRRRGRHVPLPCPHGRCVRAPEIARGFLYVLHGRDQGIGACARARATGRGLRNGKAHTAAV